MAKIFKVQNSDKTYLEINENIQQDIVDSQLSRVEPFAIEGAKEKHIPVVEINNNVLDVNVGTIDHPMTDAHYIEYILIETNKGVHLKNLNPGDSPHVQFALLDGELVLAVYAYCNLHGLWLA